MVEMTKDFQLPGETAGAADNLQVADPDAAVDTEAGDTVDATQQANDTGLPMELVEEPDQAGGQGGTTPPAPDRITQVEQSFRELQAFNTKLLDMMETVKAENQELKELLSGGTGEPEPSPDDDKPLTRKELQKLLSSPEYIQQFDQTRQTTVKQTWQDNITQQIKALQAVGIATPGSRVAMHMDEFFQKGGDALIGDPDAARKALDYAKQKLSASPPAQPKATPPPSGGGSPAGKKKASELGVEITGTGKDAFKF